MIKKTAIKKTFRGILEPDRTGLNWVIVRIPFDATEIWPNRKRLRVKGTINGFPFRTSLFGSVKDGHVLMINKKMQKGGKAKPGDLATIELEPDLEERVATVPRELEAQLKQDRKLKAWFGTLNYSMRKYISDMVTNAKGAEVRVRRAEQAAEWMMLTMEGELDPPPILQVAFRRQPQARLGWESMTPLQRRGHLLGIFYYQSPEAREKRAAKAIDEALKIAKARTE